MSRLVDKSIAEAGLDRVWKLREAERFDELHGMRAELTKADILPLGALADAIRAREVGPRVTIYSADDKAHDALCPTATFGIELLREVAVLRIISPKSRAVRVDWGAVGIEAAQVALGFGASELVGPFGSIEGPIGKARTLKLVDGAQKWREELAKLISLVGREAVFMERGERKSVAIAEGNRFDVDG